jgi:hypothetical protein
LGHTKIFFLLPLIFVEKVNMIFFQSWFPSRLRICCTCILWQPSWWNAQQWSFFSLHFKLDSCHKRRSGKITVSGFKTISHNSNFWFVFSLF